MTCASCGTESGNLFAFAGHGAAYCEKCQKTTVREPGGHYAELRTIKSKKARRLVAEVACSCGARASLHVYGCKAPEKCQGPTHVRAGTSDPVGEETCPAVVLTIRGLDVTLTREKAEWIARHGPQGAGA